MLRAGIALLAGTAALLVPVSTAEAAPAPSPWTYWASYDGSDECEAVGRAGIPRSWSGYTCDFNWGTLEFDLWVDELWI